MSDEKKQSMQIGRIELGRYILPHRWQGLLSDLSDTWSSGDIKLDYTDTSKALVAKAAKIARLEAVLQEIRDIAMYRNDGTEIINLCDSALEGGDE